MGTSTTFKRFEGMLQHDLSRNNRKTDFGREAECSLYARFITRTLISKCTRKLKRFDRAEIPWFSVEISTKTKNHHIPIINTS